ncbi:GAF and ANTAR domain-containing protein [Kineococcus sp. SYSU DK001]|uniref:GAF and ANTAR domain-containing protein n=1 Tax=Kineococcus sp. SYSU DK001 TaxID=3383122 RepID=UPI003D7D8C2E
MTESTLPPVSTGDGAEPVAAALAALARDLQREKAPVGVMQQVLDAAVAMVDGAGGGSISLVRGRRRIWSAAVTDDVARRVDAAQEDAGQGPCLDAMTAEPVVRTDDLGADPRWPALAAPARQLGVRSVLCFHLFVHGNTLGGLNLLSREPAAFDAESEAVGSMIAAHAAVALADAQQFDDLRTALGNRDLIGQAKGILMERFKVDADQAFAVLTRISQDRNVKLHHLAERLARTGSFEG